MPSDRLEKLIGKMNQSGYSEYKMQRIRELSGDLRAVGVDIERFLQILSYRVEDEQDYYDIFMEGRFALLLAANGFKNLQLEFCESGPDIKCLFEETTLFFEVRRRRPIADEWENESVRSVRPYPPEFIVKMVDDKIGQLRKDEINILAFWSDTVGFDNREVHQACELIEGMMLEKPELYRDLSCILYVSGGYDIAILQQGYAFPVSGCAKPPSRALIDKLNSLCEGDLSARQKHSKDLLKAFRKRDDAQ